MPFTKLERTHLPATFFFQPFGGPDHGAAGRQGNNPWSGCCHLPR